MRDNNNNNRTLKIELLSQWKMEAESRNWISLMSPISDQSLNGANSGSRGPREETKKRKIIRI